MEKLIANNKKARHEFFIDEVLEAGIVLKGTEVKSIRMGRANIKESYAVINGGEVFIQGMNITPYEMGNRYNPDPLRTRKLLLHKREIDKLISLTTRKGYTLVPLRLYINDKGLVKLEIGVARGKKMHDKRHDLAKKDANRDIQRALRDKQRY
ncbi:SsrA-binding protein SmpB [Acidaminobacter sp. JC074]|uniref:SsrA-binding protein SmpB n=1 Tax=Acidaminobacter sp. JC074 TaxID=2530199 RepID=UPI001F0D32E4|nr:SsrA-binding protein SmpB [Acidaminobacter sp. JC074]MCH4889116.1 SsrA-binding protein SmpB [Acidaminobacter sp. JC074]